MMRTTLCYLYHSYQRCLGGRKGTSMHLARVLKRRKAMYPIVPLTNYGCIMLPVSLLFSAAFPMSFSSLHLFFVAVSERYPFSHLNLYLRGLSVASCLTN